MYSPLVPLNLAQAALFGHSQAALSVFTLTQPISRNL